MRIGVGGLESHEVAALLNFSERMYGNGAYQSLRKYLVWLYELNPFSRGLQDCFVAREDGVIAGCVHRMRLPFVTSAGTTTLASLQNHVVAPTLRGGAGMMLLHRAVKGETVTFSPGVYGRLGEAYRRLGYNEMPNYWLVHTLAPLRAALQLGIRTLSRDRIPAAKLHLQPQRLIQALPAAVRVTVKPSTEQLEALGAAMGLQVHDGGDYVPWTADLLRWRYFSSDGPRHLLIEDSLAGSWAVLSYGVRSRVNLVRLVEFVPGSNPDFMKVVLDAARGIGAGVALAYSTRSAFRDDLLAGGWRLRKDPPSSFAKGSKEVSVSAAAADMGFEAFSTKVPT